MIINTLMKNWKWQERYLDLAEEISKWSKDPSTQCGAVAVCDKGQILSQGYNGFPRGIHDNIGLLEDKKSKYDRIVHAEMNVIYNACYNGVSLDGSSLYIYGLPLCSKCCLMFSVLKIFFHHSFSFVLFSLIYRYLKKLESSTRVKFKF